MTTGLGSRRPLVIVLFTALLGALGFMDQPLFAQIIFDNGRLNTGATTESGVAAPAGTQWSEAAHQFGTMAANTNAGVACSVTATTTFRCADDFNVPVGQDPESGDHVSVPSRFCGRHEPHPHRDTADLAGACWRRCCGAWQRPIS